MADATSLIEQGKRALNEGRKEEAQGLLLQATEVDEQNPDAWLWLASAVETEEEMRICLENVLVLDADNATAKQMINELDRGQSTSVAEDIFGSAATSAGAAADATIDDDPFGSAFGDSGFDVGDSSSGFDAGGPFSSEFEFDAPAATPPPPPTAKPPPVAEAPVDDGFAALREDSLYDDDPADDDSYDDDDDDVAPYDDGFTAGSFADDDSYDDDYDDDGYESSYGSYNDPFDDEFEDDPLAMIPPSIKPTRFPGSNEKVSGGGTPVAVVVVMGILNVLALAALIAQLVL